MKGAPIVHQRLEREKKENRGEPQRMARGGRKEIVQRLRRKVRWWDCVLERGGGWESEVVWSR